MKENSSHIIEEIQSRVFLLIIFLFIGMGISMTFAEYISYKNDSALLYRENYREQKKITKNVVENALRSIRIAQEVDAHHSVEREKKTVLEELGKIRFGYNNEGYIFVVSYDGTTLLNTVNKSFEGKNLWNFTDPRGVKVIQEERKVAEDPEGGFISYSWKKPSTGKITPKISFVMGVPGWKWMVGAGVYIDDLGKITNKLKQQTLRHFMIFMEIYFFIAILAFVGVLVSFKKIMNYVEDDLYSFVRFFEDALYRNKQIKPYKIRYIEFRTIAGRINRVIQAKKHADVRAASSEIKYKDLFSHVKDVIIITDKNRTILDVNQPALRNQFGYELNEVVGKNMLFLFKDRHEYEKTSKMFFSEEFENGDIPTVTYKKKDGTLFIAEVLAFTFNDLELSVTKNVSMNRDVTQRIKNQQMLAKSLEEKKVLLREVHHRVKNNMSVIIAFLSLQAMNIEDKKMKELLETAENRIRTMALVHEFLYQDEHLKEVNVRNYVGTLISDLINIFGAQVKWSTEIIDINLEIDVLVPLGLLINEIVTNALKHAFNGISIKHPEITIKLSRDIPGKLLLSISDNGIGLPDKNYYVNKHSIGLVLIETLVQQINGEFEVFSENGTEYRISFIVS